MRSWPPTWQRSPGSLRAGQEFLEANKSQEQLSSGIWRTQNLTLSKEYSGSRCPHTQPGPGAGGSTQLCPWMRTPGGLQKTPRGKRQSPPSLPDATSRTRRCPGPCTLRALLARAHKAPGGSQLSPAETEVTHPQVGGTLPGTGLAQEQSHPGHLGAATQGARPCLGHQGAPGPCSAPRLPGLPWSPCAR